MRLVTIVGWYRVDVLDFFIRPALVARGGSGTSRWRGDGLDALHGIRRPRFNKWFVHVGDEDSRRLSSRAGDGVE